MITNLKILCCLLMGEICFGSVPKTESNNATVNNTVKQQQPGKLHGNVAETWQSTEIKKAGYSAGESSATIKQFNAPAFWGMRLINLPTTKNIGKNDVLFRISHRFFWQVNEGYDVYWGLNGPADVLLSLGYGITPNVSVTIGHETSDHEWEVYGKWNMVHQGGKLGTPVNAALFLGGGWITEKEEGKDTFRSENIKFNAQLILSRQFTDNFSLLLMPAFSTNTNPSEHDAEGTLALGIGTKYTFFNQYSLIAEIIPVLDGYQHDSDGWGIGLEAKVGGHIFQVFVTNSMGLTADQYVPGGNLKIEDNKYRIGFNIYRSFWF